jgi:hypothetical protein
MKDETLCAIVAAAGITIVGSIYLLMGHNSVGFTVIMMALAGIAGVILPTPKIFKKR